MLESSAIHREAAQRVQHADTILDEPTVLGRVNAQCSQRNDDLRAGFAVGCAPAGESAVILLHGAEPAQSLVHSLLRAAVAFVVGCQRLDSHGGHVHIGVLAVQAPAAVTADLRVQNSLYQLVAGHIAGRRVVVAVQRDQREYRTVDALLGEVGHLIQPGQQVMAVHIRHILADGRQRQDNAGVFGGLVLVQPSVAVDVVLDILDHSVIVALWDSATTAGQPQRHPLAADAAHAGRAQLCQIVAGGLVDAVRLLAQLGHQLGVGRLSVQERLIVGHQLLVRRGKRVIRGACLGDDIALGQIHHADGVDKGDDLISGLFLLRRGAHVRRLQRVVIRVVEHDDVALLQILLTDAQHGVLAVQRIHPAGVLAVGELANGHTAVGHALDVVAGGVIPCYAGQLLQRVPHSHVGGHFHLVAADPRGQAALG